MNYHATQVKVSAKTAILLANQMQMETRAWRSLLNRTTAVPLETQTIMGAVAAQTYTHDGLRKTKKTVMALATILNLSNATAAARLRDLEGEQLLRQEPNEERGNILHWNLYDSSIAAIVNEFSELKLIILRVIALQVENPDNPTIGSDLLPPGIYYNIVDSRLKYLSIGYDDTDLSEDYRDEFTIAKEAIAFGVTE